MEKKSLAERKKTEFQNSPMRKGEKLLYDLHRIPDVTLSVNDACYGLPEPYTGMGAVGSRCDIWYYTIARDEDMNAEVRWIFSSGYHLKNYASFYHMLIEHFNPNAYLHIANWKDAEDELVGKFGFEKDESGFHILLRDLVDNASAIHTAIFK